MQSFEERHENREHQPSRWPMLLCCLWALIAIVLPWWLTR